MSGYARRVLILPTGGGGAVDSVNTQTGDVVLDATDVGADPSGTAAAEIAALIAAAPAALDTLNELAAALGDDADFAGTITAALAAKAPLESPTFTGTVTVPAPAAATAATRGRIGTEIQAFHANLAAIVALTTTSYGLSLLESANAAALRTLAGLVLGTDIPAISVTDGHETRITALETAVEVDAVLAQVEDYVLLREHFFGTQLTAGLVGQLGWNVAVSGTGADLATPILPGDGYGTYKLTTGTAAAPNRCAINLGVAHVEGVPVFTAKWRAKLDQLTSAGTQEGTVYLGMHDTNGSAVPTDGMYFRYGPSDTTWHACCNDGGAANITDVDTNVTADTNMHWFDIVCTGSAVHFYIDGTEVANSPISTNLPDAGDGYGPAAAIVKTTGNTEWFLTVDDFALLLTR